MPKLLLVEDNAILASTLVRFLGTQGDLEIVTVASTAEAALSLLPDLAVDLVLVDVSLPKMSGLEFVAILHNQMPQLPCLMFSGHSEIDYVTRALAAGAKGYVTKSKPEALFIGIKEVLSGKMYLGEDLSRKINDA